MALRRIVIDIDDSGPAKKPFGLAIIDENGRQDFDGIGRVSIHDHITKAINRAIGSLLEG